jgi:phage-related protein
MLRPKLTVRFFNSPSGREPVREWLKSLVDAERKIVGHEIRAVQFGWPIGMPLVRKMEDGLWEIRVNMADRIARVLFTIVNQEAVLLHGFIKKSQKTPSTDLDTAKRRMKQIDETVNGLEK